MVLKKLRKMVHDGARIVFMNECHFYQHGTRIRMWFPPEDRDPVVYQEPNRKGISVFGAVSLDSGRLLTSLTDRYNALTFLEFLSSAHRAFPDSIFVLDNALYHHAGLINDYVSLTGIRLFFLPPYSPDLNPIERVWKFIRKKATHNVYFASLEELKSALLRQFNMYRKKSREISQLCAMN